ncbi:GTP-binding protein Di-Ras2-like [Pseudophryne corroboree]|uniref:GTP-binding protein Di-Ras2-like n=1 Tax=Pseudophryne corroboree TaxID=495146 RepID=UPI0030813D5B
MLLEKKQKPQNPKLGTCPVPASNQWLLLAGGWAEAPASETYKAELRQLLQAEQTGHCTPGSLWCIWLTAVVEEAQHPDARSRALATLCACDSLHRAAVTGITIGADYKVGVTMLHKKAAAAAAVPPVSLSGTSSGAVRLVFMGAAGVGKTALIQRLLCDQFEPRHRRTVEEVYSLEPEPQSLQLRIEIVDTSGSYQFPAMQKLRIQQGDAFALVFSLAQPDSFQEVERLREEIVQIKGEQDVPIVVVGTHTDLFPGLEAEAGQLMALQAAATAELEWDSGYVETSAKLNHKVQDVFEELLRRINLPCLLSPALERRRASAQPEPRRRQPRRKQQDCILS